MYSDDDNALHPPQKAYGTRNARLGLAFDNGRWDAGLLGDNFTGEKYLIDAGNAGGSYVFAAYLPCVQRTFGVNPSGKFR